MQRAKEEFTVCSLYVCVALGLNCSWKIFSGIIIKFRNVATLWILMRFEYIPNGQWTMHITQFTVHTAHSSWNRVHSTQELIWKVTFSLILFFLLFVLLQFLRVYLHTMLNAHEKAHYKQALTSYMLDAGFWIVLESTTTEKK